MREYFTIMVQENSKENLGLLTEKLNNGFFIDDRIHVGKSMLIVLQKRQRSELVDSQPTLAGGISYQIQSDNSSY